MPRKASKKNEEKERTAVAPVEADALPADLQPDTNPEQDGEEVVTDWSKPISSANPPPSKRPLREQPSPVSDGDETLQKDERGVDGDLKESEEEVKDATNSKARTTRVTDVNTSTR